MVDKSPHSTLPDTRLKSLLLVRENTSSEQHHLVQHHLLLLLLPSSKEYLQTYILHICITSCRKLKQGMAQYVILPSWEELRRYKTEVILGGIQFHKMTKMTDEDEEQFCGWFLDLHDLTKYASAQINY